MYKRKSNDTLIVFGFMERQFFFFVDIRFKEIFIKLKRYIIL